MNTNPITNTITVNYATIARVKRGVWTVSGDGLTVTARTLADASRIAGRGGYAYYAREVRDGMPVRLCRTA